MPVNVMQWVQVLGYFIIVFKNLKTYQLYIPLPNCSYVSTFFHCLVFIYSLIMVKDGDIETNPGLNKKSSSSLTYCLWNVNNF